MCLAIAPRSKSNTGWFSKIWSRIAATPLRLFLFAAILHLLIIAVLLMYVFHNGLSLKMDSLLTGFSYGVLALPVAGFLMTLLPARYGLSPVYYPRYNFIYLVFMLALALIEIGSLFNVWLAEAGLWLLIIGWLIMLPVLWALHGWLPERVQAISRSLMVSLFINGFLLLLNVTGLIANWHMLMMLPWLTLVMIWPLAVTAVLLLMVKAPQKTRVVQVENK